MKCYGCYKEGIAGYCLKCRKRLFDGQRVLHILPFAAPGHSTAEQYQERVKCLSIPGVQMKYSLRLEGKIPVLTETGGQYLLKPIPPSLITYPAAAPENEHLTMQLAAQVFKIDTAANALIFFEGGEPAYLTRRFDVQPDGSKQLQEDFAQLMQRTKASHGEHYKYNGSYEEIGRLIKRYVPAYMPVLEIFFRVVLFNYLFSNGDAHMKNFSLVRSAGGEYKLSPAYDLMCTLLHTPAEADTALDLFEGDTDIPFYKTHGCYGRPHFMTLAERTGILPARAAAIINEMTGKEKEVRKMIAASFLEDAARTRYLQYYLDKQRRFTEMA